MAPFLDYYQKSAKNTRLYIGYIYDKQSPDTANRGYDKVYFGSYNGNPLEWRVLSKETEKFNSEANSGRKTMFLDCRNILAEDVYDKDNKRWRDSDVKKFLDKVCNKSIIPFQFVVPSYKEFPSGSISYYQDAPEPLENDYFFLLDRTEITDYNCCYYGGADNLGFDLLTTEAHKTYKGDRYSYWLRSRVINSNIENHAHAVIPEKYGYYYLPPKLSSQQKTTKLGISPACNIDVTKILFTSKTSDSRARLTFWDSAKKISVTKGKKVVIKGNDITIPFNITISSPGHKNALNAFSIMILDKEFSAQNGNDASILYYKSYEITSDVETKGSIAFKWPTDFDIEEWGKSYRVYILGETVSMENECDLATNPYEIGTSLLDRETYTVTFDLNGKKGEIPATQKVLKNRTVRRPANPDTDGYDFEGWYNGNSLYSFGTPVTSNLKLVAKWARSTQYNLWVGETHVSNLNCEKIPLPFGSATFDPKTDTLTFNSGYITKASKTYNGRTAAIYAKDLPLTIKGFVYIDVPSADHAIFVTQSGPKTTTMTIDAYDIKIYGSRYAIMSEGMNINFKSGDIYVYEASNSALLAVKGGHITFADKMSILSLLGSTIKSHKTLQVMYENNATEVSKTALIGKTHPNIYELWVGTERISKSNKDKIICDQGYATYDPETSTLTFNNAVIRHGFKLPHERSAAIYSRNIPLTIKGNLEIDDYELDCGIHCDDFGQVKKKLVLDGNIKMLVGNYGVFTTNKDVDVFGDRVEINTRNKNGQPFKVEGKITRIAKDPEPSIIPEPSKNDAEDEPVKEFNSGIVTAVAPDLVYKKAGKYMSKPYVSIDSKLLKNDDYTVRYKVGDTDITDAKFTLSGDQTKVTVILKGNGNYEANEVVVKDCYTIRKSSKCGDKDLNTAKITAKGNPSKSIPAQPYTGDFIIPEFDIYLKDGKSYKTASKMGLKEGKDYEVHFFNNKEKGTATIFVKALASGGKAINYKTATFDIK